METSGKHVMPKPKRTNKGLSDGTIKIADQCRATKAKDNKDKVKRLNAIFQMGQERQKQAEIFLTSIVLINCLNPGENMISF